MFVHFECASAQHHKARIHLLLGVCAIRLAAPSSIEGYAREIYSALRFADAQGLTKVCVIQPEGDGLAAAIRDRLKRAAN